MNSENSKSTGGGLTIVARILVVIEVAALVLVCLTLNSVIPFKYLGIAIGVMILILALQIVLVSGNGRMKGRSIASIILSILLIGASVFCILFVRNTEKKLNEMTENAVVATTEVTTEDGQKKVISKVVSTMNVYVRKADSYTALADLKGKTLGVLDMMDQDNTAGALKQLAEEFGAEPETVKMAGILPLCNALKNSEADAIIINTGYETSITDNDPTFNDWAKLLCTIDVTKEVEDGADASDVTAATVTKTAAAPVEDITVQPFLIYLTGMDTRTDAIVAEVGNSDVNMIIAVNPQTKKLLMINIPRDYYYYLWGDSNYPDKITHSGYYGVDCGIQTMNSLFDINLNYYVKVGFNSVINIVDALGGITVWSDYEFVIDDVYIAAGENYLSGYPALMFARERESLPGGDRARGMNQQEVIKAIIAKITSAEWLPRFNDVLGAITSNVMTNISVSDMEAILKMQLNDNASWDIQSLAVDGAGGWDYCYSLGDSNDIMYPTWDTVETAKSAIAQVMSGQ